MALVTLRIIDGADRGTVFDRLETPVTIGREEGNTLQLKDERVSRFHVKIQEDHGKIVLVDLESTNGTRVNGEDIHLRILRYGDMIHVGRSVILYGSEDEIADRLAQLRVQRQKERGEEERTNGPLNPSDSASSLEFELNWNNQEEDLQAAIYSLEPPELPERLSPAQAAQLAELMEYIHIRIRHLLLSVEVNDAAEKVALDTREWQNLLDLQARISILLRRIGDPGL
ncbi:FHA domain-containing protein [Blastopirellula retiformator]|uniref:FHA domain-containing protein FhaA n=1 Tax=Blastopirellula retiformator TaxID=2527970 RepID=A0A5C5V2V3_9BACT|nr:FHA domain-containing protein [Blastopirellula retiformator]TWT32711.1 FHA domain-containing protein FhaA [Blastopirellula retiformator]